MKKLFVSMLIVVLLFVLFTSAIYAEASGKTPEKITEVPDIRIIIDGKLTKYSDTPININEKNLLPLRELLENLGVRNDDEHIKYNHEDKSVTIRKDETEIILTVGSTTAYVNGSPAELDVAPVFYVKGNDGKVYIPLAFVSEALGKKVVWDGSSRTVLVCDKAKYANIKEILDKSDKAAKEINKYKLAIHMEFTSGTGQVEFGLSWNRSIDTQQKKMLMEMDLNMFGVNTEMSAYYTDNASYILNPMTLEWQKQTYSPAEYDTLFAEQRNTGMIEYNDILYAGLNQEQSKNPEEILLKGDVVLGDMLTEALNAQDSTFMPSGDDFNFDDFNIELILDAETYLVKSLMVNKKSITENEEGSIETQAVLKLVYSDYDGDFEIVIPEDVVKNAVEIEKEKL